MIVEADRLGLQVKVHAIGDAGVRMTLDAYQAAQKANGKRDSRHRIEHVELLHNDDFARFRELVLLDCDLFEVKTAEVRSVMTVCDGEVVFEK